MPLNRSEKVARGEIAHECSGSKGPFRAFGRKTHRIPENSQLLVRDAHHISDLVREALTRHIAILYGRKQRSEKQHQSIGILVMPSDGLRDEIERIAADLLHRATTIEDETVLPLDQKPEF